MKKYMLKRILFSIFSLLVVIMVVMFLVYTAINRNVIFQSDDVWNKRTGNERTMYEYSQFQKYGYLDFANYTSFLQSKYYAIYGDSYTSQKDYIASLFRSSRRSIPPRDTRSNTWRLSPISPARSSPAATPTCWRSTSAACSCVC